jgi:hypothetical protein
MSLNVTTKLVYYNICLPFQWCPLCCITIAVPFGQTKVRLVKGRAIRDKNLIIDGMAIIKMIKTSL